MASIQNSAASFASSFAQPRMVLQGEKNLHGGERCRMSTRCSLGADFMEAKAWTSIRWCRVVGLLAV